MLYKIIIYKTKRNFHLNLSLLINICLIIFEKHFLKTKKFDHIPLDCFQPRILVKSYSLLANIKINMLFSFEFHVQLFFLNLDKIVFLSKFFIICLILQNKKMKMKKIAFTLLALTLFLASCEKDDESQSYDPIPNEGY